jgi:predicted ATP-dependent protease
MSDKNSKYLVPVEKLCWRIDPAGLAKAGAGDGRSGEEIIGQPRGVQAFRFAMQMNKSGYNVFVTGHPGIGRLEAIKKMLAEIAGHEKSPDDLCYVNNFKSPEAPILLRFKAGDGGRFKEGMREVMERLKTLVPQLFESEEYINRRKEITSAYEKKTTEFFKGLDKRVKEMGFSLVQIPDAHQQRPQLMPMVDGEPVPLPVLEERMEKGRFPRKEYAQIKEKFETLKREIDKIFLDIRELQKDLQDKGQKFEQMMFRNMAAEQLRPLREAHEDQKVQAYVESVLDDLSENIQIFMPVEGQSGGPARLLAAGDQFQPYQVNLLVDNAKQKQPPVIIESYPTYRNLFGTIERIVDRSGVWRTDFSKIQAGSFLKANGGYLVLNLIDLLTEPGVWPALKRALKTEEMEIQTFDPFYWFTSTGLKPEAIPMEIKVVVLGDPRLYYLLRYYDEEVAKIFKVRADFDSTMNRDEEAIGQLAGTIRATVEREKLRALDASALAVLLEHMVRVTGRQEKIAVSTPLLEDLLSEADSLAGRDGAEKILGRHIEQALNDRIYRANLIEEKIQEMIDRGSLLIEVDGCEIGQVNGLAVISLGEYMFGRPSRITAVTSMGRDGIINIEREADLAGSIHNKGVLILSGYLRRMYAQDKPLSVSASLAFEQSYSGVDGDSASSTELYALLSSLAEVPIDQGIAVTGSVNQKGEVQAIGGVNEKIEGFYEVCRKKGITGRQGVMIPASNVQDLMLRRQVVEAVAAGRFQVWAVKNINEGLEILTGKKAGERDPQKGYPAGSLNRLVDAKLLKFAKGLQAFASGRNGAKKATSPQKKAGNPGGE